MRGAAGAGMRLVLEAAGLMPSFDRVYGCSSGAVTGAFAAAGQASLWATSFEDCACRTFIDRSRAFRGGPVVDLDFLFGEVIARRRTLSEAGLAAGPEFRAVAVSATARGTAGAARLREHGWSCWAPCGRAARSRCLPAHRRRTGASRWWMAACWSRSRIGRRCARGRPT